MDINKRILNDLQYVSREEQKQIMNLYSNLNTEPSIKLVMAIFRDITMFREMSQALILKYKHKIDELEQRIEELENK